MSSRPVVGVTSSIPLGVHPDSYEKWKPYRDAVRSLGGEAIALYNDTADPQEVLRKISAVLFSGGADVGVALYGGRSDAAGLSPTDAERDAYEIVLVRAAFSASVPVLCICRGMQLATVAFGGTLIEDLPEEMGERYVLMHRQTTESGLGRDAYGIGHTVRVEPTSALAHTLSGHTCFPSNSMHHQAVRMVPSALRAVAWTDDGVIEALDAEDVRGFFHCVQWHPEELLPRGNLPSKQLFTAFLTAAGGRGGAPKRNRAPNGLRSGYPLRDSATSQPCTSARKASQ